MSGPPASRSGIPAHWRVPVVVAAVALLVAGYSGWQAKALDTGAGSVQLGRAIFALIAIGGLALMLGAAALAARLGRPGVARAITLSTIALVLGYLVAYALAPEAAA